jgi:proteic killer suppression protein
VIKSFGNKETEKLFQREVSRSFPPEIIRKARSKLEILDAAEKLDDLKVPPGNRLEKLSGDRAGQYSIRINQQWRICFRWKDGNCFDVMTVDYH